MQIFTSSPLLRHLLTLPWQSAGRRSRDGEWFVWSRMKSSKPKHAFGKVANLLAFTEKDMRFLGERNVLVPTCPIASCSWQGWQGGGMVTVPVALRGPPNSAHTPQLQNCSSAEGLQLRQKAVKSRFGGKCSAVPRTVSQESSKALHQSIPLPNRYSWPPEQPPGRQLSSQFKYLTYCV